MEGRVVRRESGHAPGSAALYRTSLCWEYSSSVPASASFLADSTSTKPSMALTSRPVRESDGSGNRSVRPASCERGRSAPFGRKPQRLPPPAAARSIAAADRIAGPSSPINKQRAARSIRCSNSFQPCFGRCLSREREGRSADFTRGSRRAARSRDRAAAWRSASSA